MRAQVKKKLISVCCRRQKYNVNVSVFESGVGEMKLRFAPYTLPKSKVFISHFISHFTTNTRYSNYDGQIVNKFWNAGFVFTFSQLSITVQQKICKRKTEIDSKLQFN